MSTLNIVNKSPFEKRSLEQCLMRIGKGDSVLLIEDAVVASAAVTSFSEQLLGAAQTINMYVLQPDLDARGFGSVKLLSGFKTVDYTGFVSLAAEHDRVNSWL